ncbi:hypothetical protein [Dactylosporangium sp. CS-033363]|uniref:hypothetical protein n=1 Tax=Dactylosporangium sp. CS-033363 TaxID=3239935 RepID=UPI003D8BED48
MTLLIRVDPGVATPADPGPALPGAALPGADEEPKPELTPAERDIVAAYRLLCAGYERRLDAIRPRRTGPVRLPDFPAVYPTLPGAPAQSGRPAREPVDLPPVPLDGTLLGSLCFVYAVHGWAAIEAVQQAVLDAYLRAVKARGPADVEQLASRFFAATRDLLARLVHQTLAELEARAAAVVTAGLAVSRTKIEEACRQLGVEVLELDEPAPPYTGPPGTTTTSRYVFASRELSIAVHRQLVTIARQMSVLGTLLGYQRGMERRGDAPRSGPARANYLESIEVLKRNAKQTDLIVESLRKADVFTERCPLALLALSMVGRFTTRLDMEDRLGSVLAQLRESAAQLTRIRMGERVGTLTAGAAGAADLDLTGGPERAVLRAALKAVGEDRRWTPMLHEPTWDALIRTGDVPPGGFGYVVAQQYRAALIEHRIAAEAEAAADRRLMGGVQRVAAALSLAGLVLAPFGGVAVIAALGTGVGLTAAAVSVAAVVAGVAELADELGTARVAVDVGLTGPDPVAFEHLAELGARARFVHEMTGALAEQIGETVLLELVGKVLPVVKLAWTGYGYCQDLQTLLGGEADEPAPR